MKQRNVSGTSRLSSRILDGNKHSVRFLASHRRVHKRLLGRNSAIIPKYRAEAPRRRIPARVMFFVVCFGGGEMLAVVASGEPSMEMLRRPSCA